MDFSLSPEQLALQYSVTRLLADRCPLDRVRQFADNGEVLAADLWSALSTLGVPAILVPDAHGGLGLGLLDAALVSEALGAAAAPTPFLGSTLAVLAIREAGTADQQARLLSDLASGHATGAVALSEAVAGARDSAGLSLRDNIVTGKSLFVMDGESAAVIVAAIQEGLVVLGDGAALSPMPSIDRTRRLAELRCGGIAAEALPGNNVTTALQAQARVRDAAFVLLAADMLGASQTMLDRAVAYSRDRVQFGRAIGSFQAVKHLCAEMAAALEPCRALVWYAAHAFDQALPDAPLAAAHAKAHLSEVSRYVARTATEVHGGMGFTDLLGLHYWFKRVGLDRQLLGGPEHIRRHAARLQGF